MREIWKYRDNIMIAFDTDSRVIGVQMIRPGRVQWQGRWLDGRHTGEDVVNVFGDPSFVSHWMKEDGEGVEYVIYGYRPLGFGVLTDPKTDRIVGYIVAEPEGESAPAAPTPEAPPVPPPPYP